MNSWQKKSKENPFFVLADDCQYEPYSPVDQFISSDFRSQNSRASLLNNITGTIQDETANYINKITSTLGSIDVEEENRIPAHVDILKNNINEIVLNAYSKLWNEVHRDHQAKVNEDNRALEVKSSQINFAERSLQGRIDYFESDKYNFESEKNKIQLELYNIYSYLQEQLKSVEKMKSKLQQNFDDQGNVISSPRLGRPRKQNIPPSVSSSMDIVANSEIVVGENGQSPRKRGRPRKVVS
jgi:hypothetical protein